MTNISYKKLFSKFGTYYQFREIRAPPSSRLASATDCISAYINGTKIEPRDSFGNQSSFAIKSFLIETLVEYLPIFAIYTKKRKKYVLISFKLPFSYTFRLTMLIEVAQFFPSLLSVLLQFISNSVFLMLLFNQPRQ